MPSDKEPFGSTLPAIGQSKTKRMNSNISSILTNPVTVWEIAHLKLRTFSSCLNFLYAPGGRVLKGKGGGLLARRATGRANYSARADGSLCSGLGGGGKVGSVLGPSFRGFPPRNFLPGRGAQLPASLKRPAQDDLGEMPKRIGKHDVVWYV